MERTDLKQITNTWENMTYKVLALEKIHFSEEICQKNQ